MPGGPLCNCPYHRVGRAGRAGGEGRAAADRGRVLGAGVKRKFQETVELQLGIKDYDPNKDKRFNGTIRLKHCPRPNMKVCILGDVKHVEEAESATHVHHHTFLYAVGGIPM